jgi:hypothetical protein
MIIRDITIRDIIILDTTVTVLLQGTIITIITDLLQDTTAVMADRTVGTMAAIMADIIDNLRI